MTAIDLLGNAIILQAVDDYRRALRRLTHEDDEKRRRARRNIKEIEQFFRSRWFAALTNLNPETLIARLKGEKQ